MADEEANHYFLSLIAKYESQVSLPAKCPAMNRGPWTVILTGSTGSMGIYLLSAMQACPRAKIRRIYCLNRSADARERHIKELKDRQLPALDDSRVTFLTAIFGAANFGIDSAIYKRLKDEVTLILHNAWPVNFLMTVDDFLPHVDGVRDFLQFSYDSPRNPPVLFVSSLASSFVACPDGIREAVHDRPHLIPDYGYGRSKYLSERMVEKYTKATGLPAAILRVDQVGGPINSGGMWPRREWFPTLLRSSLYLGVLPGDLGNGDAIQWLPVDVLPQIVIEIADDIIDSVAAGKFTRRIFNLTNPKRGTFAAILPALRGISRTTVSFEEWITMLADIAARSDAEKRRQIPGWKLAPFLKTWISPSGSANVSTGNLESASRTAREIPGVNLAWMEQWLRQWELPTAPSLAGVPRL